MTERKRIESVLTGVMPDRLPWATRLEIWYHAHLRTGTLPAPFIDKTLDQVHQYLGVGRQAYAILTPFKLTGVDCEVEFEGEKVSCFREPVLTFPKVASLVPTDSPGRTRITFKTPVGTLVSVFRTTQEILDSYATPYLEKHMLSDDGDYAAVGWILEKGETVPTFEEFSRSESEIGDNGMTMGMIERVPFQRLLLDFMGEERCFFEMHDNPKAFEHVMSQLTEIHRVSVKIACESPALVVECGDNLDGYMTNPDLFKRLSLPIMQETADLLHAAEKYYASHVDGDLSALVDIMPETGLDVAESFSPYPLSQLTFDKAYSSWGNKPVMWGILPSPLFEARVPAETFKSEMRAIIERIDADHPVILGIADQAVKPSLWERVREIPQLLSASNKK